MGFPWLLSATRRRGRLSPNASRGDRSPPRGGRMFPPDVPWHGRAASCAPTQSVADWQPQWEQWRSSCSGQAFSRHTQRPGRTAIAVAKWKPPGWSPGVARPWQNGCQWSGNGGLCCLWWSDQPRPMREHSPLNARSRVGARVRGRMVKNTLELPKDPGEGCQHQVCSKCRGRWDDTADSGAEAIKAPHLMNHEDEPARSPLTGRIWVWTLNSRGLGSPWAQIGFLVGILWRGVLRHAYLETLKHEFRRRVTDLIFDSW